MSVELLDIYAEYYDTDMDYIIMVERIIITR